MIDSTSRFCIYLAVSCIFLYCAYYYANEIYFFAPYRKFAKKCTNFSIVIMFLIGIWSQTPRAVGYFDDGKIDHAGRKHLPLYQVLLDDLASNLFLTILLLIFFVLAIINFIVEANNIFITVPIISNI